MWVCVLAVGIKNIKLNAIKFIFWHFTGIQCDNWPKVLRVLSISRGVWPYICQNNGGTEVLNLLRHSTLRHWSILCPDCVTLDTQCTRHAGRTTRRRSTGEFFCERIKLTSGQAKLIRACLLLFAQVKARKKVAMTVLTFVLIFGVCFLPNYIFMLWFYF